MVEQNRVASARAILQQETARALTEALDAKGPLICLEDATVAVALHLGAFVAINGADEELRERLFAIVMLTARRACEVGLKARAEREAKA